MFRPKIQGLWNFNKISPGLQVPQHALQTFLNPFPAQVVTLKRIFPVQTQHILFCDRYTIFSIFCISEVVTRCDDNYCRILVAHVHYASCLKRTPRPSLGRQWVTKTNRTSSCEFYSRGLLTDWVSEFLDPSVRHSPHVAMGVYYRVGPARPLPSC